LFQKYFKSYVKRFEIFPHYILEKMSIGTPNGILDITNAIVRVSKMEFQQATGFDTVFNNIARNTILLTDSATYETATTYHNWALKLPNAWVLDADVYLDPGTVGDGDHTLQLNFYNNTNTAVINGYTLGLDGTSITLSYDGTQLDTATLSTTINTGTWHKLFVLFEKDTIAVAIDGKFEYTFTDSELRARIYNEDTGYVVFYHEAGVARKIKNIKFVNGDKWSRVDGTSNIAYLGGSVGIGTSTPAYTLDINGDINFSGNVYQGASPFISSLWTDGESSLYYRSNVEVGTANLFVDTTTGNVGIGTSTPAQALDVSGNVQVGTANLFVDTTTGNVGVGTSTPAQALDVSGNVQVGTANLFVDTTTGNVGIGTSTPAQALDVSGNVQVGTANLFVDTTTGQVGIGTSTPTQALDVSGNVQVGTANLFVDTTTGNVGIGTSTPVASLHINSTDSIVLPSGTTAERNQTPTIGMLRYNSQTGYLEAYTSTGWGSIATPPTLTSFSPSVVTPAASNGTDLTINGGFFDQNTTVQLRAQNGTLYSTTNLVFTNSGLITVTLGSLALDSYTVVVTNGAGLSVDSTSTLVVNNPPVWSSPAAGATLGFFTNISSTTTLSATDPDGGTITYSLVGGNLPPGLTLSGSTISGTSGASVGTQTPITIRASDGIGFTDRSFTIATQSEGEAVFTTATTHTWTVPTGVFSVSAVAVGGGGGGVNYFGSGGAGGGLAYRNNISVTPGQQYSVVVGAGGPGLISGTDNNVASGSQPANNGGTSSFGSFFSATGGQHGGGYGISNSLPSGGVPSGSYTGGGNGGSTYGPYSASQGDGSYVSSGGGGAGGYSGTGGIGGGSNPSNGAYVNATAGTGGGGGGGAGMATGTGANNYGGGGGGGVGLFGQGSNGVAGTIDLTQASPDGNMVGGGGSGGGPGGVPPSPQLGGPGGLYGGGGGSCNGNSTASDGGNGGQGAVRIIWGNNRVFPSTNVGQSQSYGNVSTY
jgi:hypothetical protein